MALKKLRQSKSLSQSQLAADSGVNIKMIQKYEQGVKDINNARYETLLRLANTLGCSIRDLIDYPQLDCLIKKYEDRIGADTMDRFFSRKTCERCHKPLDRGRTMSMFNTQCICLECAEAEQHDPEYKKAVEADHAEIRKGNYNYKGLRG